MTKSYLENIIGLPLVISRHAADMLVLHFGKIARKDNQSWGQYALHIQAPWRIIKDSTILVGKDDRWNPIGEVDDFDEWYNNPHPSVEDQFWKEFMGGINKLTKSFEGEASGAKVTSIHENEIGDLALEFSNNCQLQVFGSGTDNEFWRLFQPKSDTEHYVVGMEKISE